MLNNPDRNQLKKTIWRLSIPTMIGYALQTVYDVVDMIWVGRISKEAVAGITIFSMIFWLGTVLNEMMNASAISMISQCYGRKDDPETGRLIEQSIAGKILISVVAAAIIFVLAHFALPLFTADAEVRRTAWDYGVIRTLFIPFLFASYSVNTALRSIGHPRTQMVLMAIAAVLNILLDPIFMFDRIPGIGLPGFGMGVRGAAVATVLSTIIAFLVGLLLLLRSTDIPIRLRGMIRIHAGTFVQFLRVGLPAGAENLFRNLLFFLLVRFVSGYGTYAITTAGIGMRLYGFAYVPLIGAFTAGSTMIANLLGAEKPHLCRAAARLSVRLSVGGTAALTVLAFLFPEQLMRIFIDNADVVAAGIPMIRMMVPALLLGAVAMGLATAFIGSGDNKPFLIASVVARWGVQLPLVFLVTEILHQPLHFVWLTFVIAGAIELLMIVIPYRRGHWLQVRV